MYPSLEFRTIGHKVNITIKYTNTQATKKYFSSKAKNIHAYSNIISRRTDFYRYINMFVLPYIYVYILTTYIR